MLQGQLRLFTQQAIQHQQSHRPDISTKDLWISDVLITFIPMDGTDFKSHDNANALNARDISDTSYPRS